MAGRNRAAHSTPSEDERSAFPSHFHSAEFSPLHPRHTRPQFHPRTPLLYDRTPDFNIYTNNNSTTQYGVVPASEAAAGDYYTFESNNANLTTHENIGMTIATTNAGGAFTMTYPPAWNYSGPAAAAFPTFAFNYSDFGASASVVYSAQLAWQESATTEAQITTFATTAYLSANTNYTVPNLTALSGFLQTPASGTQVFWSARVYGQPYPAYFAANPNPSTATTYHIFISSSYNEP